MNLTLTTRSRSRLIAGLAVAAMTFALQPAASAAGGAKSCDTRENNTYSKLTECVTVEKVRAHQAALQTIADENQGIRASGTPGYDASVDYIVERLEAAGYAPEVHAFTYNASTRLGPSVFAQLSPNATTYVQDVDYDTISQTDGGDVTAPVQAVDLQLGLGNASTSGCEAADFAGFAAGSIALLQRGACSFQLKAENAAAAGAVGAIIFNQGNTEDRRGLINGTLSAGYSGGIPVLEATTGLGEELASTPGVIVRLFANVFRGEATTYNVTAETAFGDDSNVVMVGAHLDSVDAGPGINDNGSGSAAILAVAEAMARVEVANTVRFAWWGAEESGLVGSTRYVAELSEEERDAIALYLNFDMIGSPNHMFMIYDADQTSFAGSAPEGSVAIEDVFESYFTQRGLPYDDTAFSGRSDYGPFIAVGIPSGGLFTGAEVIKTEAQEAIWGGTAGEQLDPCYHLACDTYDNNNMFALDVNSDAVAFSTLTFAFSTASVNGVGDGHVPGSPKPLVEPAGPAGTVGFGGGGGLHDDHDHEGETS